MSSVFSSNFSRNYSNQSQGTSSSSSSSSSSSPGPQPQMPLLPFGLPVGSGQQALAPAPASSSSTSTSTRTVRVLPPQQAQPSQSNSFNPEQFWNSAFRYSLDELLMILFGDSALTEESLETERRSGMLAEKVSELLDTFKQRVDSRPNTGYHNLFALYHFYQDMIAKLGFAPEDLTKQVEKLYILILNKADSVQRSLIVRFANLLEIPDEQSANRFREIIREGLYMDTAGLTESNNIYWASVQKMLKTIKAAASAISLDLSLLKNYKFTSSIDINRFSRSITDSCHSICERCTNLLAKLEMGEEVQLPKYYASARAISNGQIISSDGFKSGKIVDPGSFPATLMISTNIDNSTLPAIGLPNYIEWLDPSKLANSTIRIEDEKITIILADGIRICTVNQENKLSNLTASSVIVNAFKLTESQTTEMTAIDGLSDQILLMNLIEAELVSAIIQTQFPLLVPKDYQISGRRTLQTPAQSIQQQIAMAVQNEFRRVRVPTNGVPSTANGSQNSKKFINPVDLLKDEVSAVAVTKFFAQHQNKYLTKEHLRAILEKKTTNDKTIFTLNGQKTLTHLLNNPNITDFQIGSLVTSLRRSGAISKAVGKRANERMNVNPASQTTTTTTPSISPAVTPAITPTTSPLSTPPSSPAPTPRPAPTTNGNGPASKRRRTTAPATVSNASPSASSSSSNGMSTTTSSNSTVSASSNSMAPASGLNILATAIEGPEAIQKSRIDKIKKDAKDANDGNVRFPLSFQPFWEWCQANISLDQIYSQRPDLTLITQDEENQLYFWTKKFNTCMSVGHILAYNKLFPQQCQQAIMDGLMTVIDPVRQTKDLTLQQEILNTRTQRQQKIEEAAGLFELNLSFCPPALRHIWDIEGLNTDAQFGQPVGYHPELMFNIPVVQEFLISYIQSAIVFFAQAKNTEQGTKKKSEEYLEMMFLGVGEPALSVEDQQKYQRQFFSLVAYFILDGAELPSEEELKVAEFIRCKSPTSGREIAITPNTFDLMPHSGRDQRLYSNEPLFAFRLLKQIDENSDEKESLADLILDKEFSTELSEKQKRRLTLLKGFIEELGIAIQHRYAASNLNGRDLLPVRFSNSPLLRILQGQKN